MDPSYYGYEVMSHGWLGAGGWEDVAIAGVEGGYSHACGLVWRLVSTLRLEPTAPSHPSTQPPTTIHRTQTQTHDIQTTQGCTCESGYVASHHHQQGAATIYCKRQDTPLLLAAILAPVLSAALIVGALVVVARKRIWAVTGGRLSKPAAAKREPPGVASKQVTLVLTDVQVGGCGVGFGVLVLLD